MRRRIIEFAVLLSVALGAPPLSAAIWQWSTTPGTNASADPSINWSEGMSPSSVNDSARAMMSVIAGWRNDISAANTTAGTSTAYTLTTSEGLNTTPVNGQMIAFVAHATNGVAPTLTVDGGNTYPIWLNGAAVGSATLVAGTPYRIAFSTTNSAWLLEAGYGNPYNIGLGSFLLSTIATPPNSNFIIPAGQCISTTTYSVYWIAIGSPASGGCPGGQFAVIDARGRNLTPLDNIGGTAANRLTNSSLGCGVAFTTMGATCSNGNEKQTLTAAQLPASIPYSLVWQFTPSGSATYYLATVPASNTNVGGGVGASLPVNSYSAVTLGGSVGVSSGSINPSGGGAHPVTNPNLGVYAYLRVL